MEKNVIKRQSINIEVLWTSQNDFTIKQQGYDITIMECIGILEYAKKQMLVNALSCSVENVGVPITRLTIEDFIEKNEMQVRLTNALYNYRKDYNAQYADEIQLKKIAKYRNVGPTSLKVLSELLKKLNK